MLREQGVSIGKKLRRLAPLTNEDEGTRRLSECVERVEERFNASVDAPSSGISGGDKETEGVRCKDSKIPTVENRMSIWGVVLRRIASGADVEGETTPGEGPDPFLDLASSSCPWEVGCRDEDGGSGLIFPIDIFFKKPQRLPFSLLSLCPRPRAAL
jgi:hypothetical protein